MDEYIERKKLEEAFDNADPDVCESDLDGHSNWGFGRENVRVVIRGIPAADVVPVVHGRWIDNGASGYKWSFICSRCGYVDGYPFTDRYNFCPDCGARMDGDSNAFD